MRRTLVLLLSTLSLVATGVVAGLAVGGTGTVEPPPRIVFVANGVNPADALAAGAIGTDSSSVNLDVYAICADVGQIVDVSVFNTNYDPDPTIAAGDTIRWTNAGGNHNVRADDDSFDNGAASFAAWTYERSFDTPGTYGYYCTVHGSTSGGMRGTVTVTS